MALKIAIFGRAGKELKGLAPDDRDRVRRRIREFAFDPTSPRHDVVPLVGSPGDLRPRVGDWRVIYSLTDDEMSVRHVLHRREAYR